MTPTTMNATALAASLDPASVQELVRAYCGPGPARDWVDIDVLGRRAVVFRPPGPAVEPVADRLIAMGLLDGGGLTQSGRRTLQILVAAMLIDGATP